MKNNHTCKECNTNYPSAKSLSDHRLYMRKQGQGHTARVPKKEGENFTFTCDSKSTLETMFKQETPEQTKARKEAQALLEAEPSLESLIVDPSKKTETQIQSVAIFQECKDEREEEKNCFDSPSHSQDSNSSGEKSKILALKSMLRLKPCWKKIKLIAKSGNFKEVLNLIVDFDNMMSFLIIARKYTLNRNPYFSKAVAFAINFLNQNKIDTPVELINDFRSLFDEFKINESVQPEQDLRVLFKLCRQTRGCTKWIKLMKRPYSLFENVAALSGCANIIFEMMQHKYLFALSYFDLVDYIMQNPVIASPVSGLLQILKQKQIQVDLPLKEALLNYSNVENSELGKENVQRTSKQLLVGIKQSLSFSKFLEAIRAALELNNIEDVKTLMFLDFNSKDQLKDIVKNQLTTMTQQQIKQLKIKEDEEEKEQQKKENLKKLEEEKKEKQSLIDEAKQKKKQEILKVYIRFCEENKIEIDDQRFMQFVDQMEYIASCIGYEPRSYQYVMMFNILVCKNQFVFIEQPTSTGKSLMLFLMARYTSLAFPDLKVVITSPTLALAAKQLKLYCQEEWASMAIDTMFEEKSKGLFVCVFSDLQKERLLPLGTILFIDEFDTFLFDFKPIILINQLVSPLVLLNKCKTIGLTATLRGQQAESNLRNMFRDVVIIKNNKVTTERILDLDVFGGLGAEQVKLKIIEVAKAKQNDLPVIIMLPTLQDCQMLKEQFQECYVFGLEQGQELIEGKLSGQLGIITTVQSIKRALWPIILTTSFDVLGHSLTKLAYVIQINFAKSRSIFIQNAGRSNRVDLNSPLVGAFITQEQVKTVQDVEEGCKLAENRQPVLRADYMKSVLLLEQCCRIDQKPKSFQDAFESLIQQNVSLNTICTLLGKVKNFQKVLKDKEQLFKPQFESISLVKLDNFLPTQVDSQELDETLAQNLLGKRVKDSDLNDSNYSSSNEAQFIKRQKVNQNPQLDVKMQDTQDQGDTFLMIEEQQQISQEGNYQPGILETREAQSHEVQMTSESTKLEEEKTLLKQLAQKHNIALVPLFQDERDDEQMTESKISVGAQSVAGKKQEKIGDYSCQTCGKFFNTADKRKKHKYAIHNEQAKAKHREHQKKYAKK